ncbi:MAG: PIG-L deacetylase family protein [Thermodesulfovibrionales bacterium]
MIASFSRILAVAAHLDDVELGCAGIISRYRRSAEFHVLALSCERRDSRGAVQEVRDKKEAQKALRLMGLKPPALSIENIPTQLFDSHPQEIREILIRHGERLRPDLVLVPSKNDIHQDHRMLCEQAEKVFKRTSLLGYEIINSSFTFMPSLYVEIAKKDLDRKIAAVSSYVSQMNPDTTTADYFSREVLESLAVTRGVKIGVRYAEAFEIYRLVMR